MAIFNGFKNFPIKLFLGIMFYPSFFNRCHFINRNHKFLKDVSIDRNSVIKILIVEKIKYVSVSSKKISQAMFERAEINMSMCASFNPRNFLVRNDSSGITFHTCRNVYILVPVS